MVPAVFNGRVKQLEISVDSTEEGGEEKKKKKVNTYEITAVLFNNVMYQGSDVVRIKDNFE